LSRRLQGEIGEATGQSIHENSERIRRNAAEPGGRV
jgi:hypothetical protein